MHHPSHGVCGSHSRVRFTCCKREDAYIRNQKHEIPSSFAGGQCIYILERYIRFTAHCLNKSKKKVSIELVLLTSLL